MSSQPRPEGTWAVITYLPVMKSVIFAYNFRIVWPKWIRLAFYHHETWYVTSTMALAEYIHIHIQLCENKRLLQNYPFLWIYCLWTVLFYSISNWPDSKYKYCHLKHLLQIYYQRMQRKQVHIFKQHNTNVLTFGNLDLVK